MKRRPCYIGEDGKTGKRGGKSFYQTNLASKVPADQGSDAGMEARNSLDPLKPISHHGDAFSLIEMIVSMGILAIMIAFLLLMVSQTQKTWKGTAGKIEQFRAARDAFDTMTRRISQATLNTYLDYNNPANPSAYIRQSELRFLSGPTDLILPTLTIISNTPTMGIFFQAPNGFSTNTNNALLQNALNTWGYYIEYGSDTNLTVRPSYLSGTRPIPRVRYRLMEFMEPTDNLSVYSYTSTNRNYQGVEWITNTLGLPESSRPSHVLAENVIAMILLPKHTPADLARWGSAYSNSSLAPDYIYSSATNRNSGQNDARLNTRNQLPPVIQVTIVAVDETSAIRFPSALANLTNVSSQGGYGDLFTNAANFETDLRALQRSLSTNKINFRVFTTEVMVKGAKWSSAQTN
jgi:uncharacterized protein (TIGR02599 family)